MECRQGYAKCPKTCRKPGCEDTCEYAAQCCGKYCSFPPALIGEPLGIGRPVTQEEAQAYIDEILANKPTPRAQAFIDWLLG